MKSNVNYNENHILPTIFLNLGRHQHLNVAFLNVLTVSHIPHKFAHNVYKHIDKKAFKWLLIKNLKIYITYLSSHVHLNSTCSDRSLTYSEE